MSVNVWQAPNIWVSGIVITLQPIGASVTEPTLVSLTSAATGATSSQWYKDLALISGEVTDNLTINPSAISDSGDYFNRYSDGLSTLDTNTVTVTVLAASSASPNYKYITRVNGKSSITRVK